MAVKVKIGRTPDGNKFEEINLPAGQIVAEDGKTLQQHAADDTLHPPAAATSQSGQFLKVNSVGKPAWAGAGLVANDIPTIPHTKVSGLGSAATKATGTGAGQVPILGNDGKLDSSLMPAVVIFDYAEAASEAEMLKLDLQRGDWCIRTDLGGHRFLLLKEPATVLSNWLKVNTECAVVSVNGKTGAIQLTKEDIGLGNVDNTADASKNVLSATRLAAARTIQLTGAVTGSVSTNLSGTATITTTKVAKDIAVVDSEAAIATSGIVAGGLVFIKV